jgi:mediator of RNA polymerase II transcription subunit 12
MATLLQTAAPTPSGQGDLATPTPDEDTPANATYLQDLLRLLLLDLTAPSVLTAEEAYRFGVHQRSAPLEHSKGLLNLIRNAIAEYAVAPGPDLKSPLSDESLRKQILEVLQSLVIADADAVSNALSIKTLPAAATALVCNLTNSLLKPDNEEGANPSFDDVLGLANELTMPFCQLKLNMDLSMEQPSSSPFAADEPQAMSRFDLFAKAMDRAIEADNISWTRMLPCLSNDITLHLKNQAYERFLAMLPSMKSQDVVSDAISGERIRMAENLLGVLGVIVSGQPPPNTAQLTQTMVEKLSDLWEIVAARDESLNRAQVIVIESWLPKLLKFITLHSISASEAMPAPSATASTGKVPPPPAQEARARIIVALCGLLLDLESRPDYTALNTSQHIFDAATSLVDSLPDDLRVQCIKTILFTPGASPSPNLSSDPRLHYILSNPILSAADGLLLGRRRELPAQPHSSTARLFGNLYGCGPAMLDRFSPFLLKRWELLSEPTPNIGENDTSLSLSLFEAIKIQ